MKWVKIISLRCVTNIDTAFVNELFKGISESDSATDMPEHLVEIRRMSQGTSNEGSWLMIRS